MSPVINQMIPLKELLNKFVDVMFVSETELTWMKDYIFSDNPVVNLVADDSEIYETLIFLRDIARENNYQSIEEILDYFETQKSNLIRMVEPLLSNRENDLSGLNICRVFDFSIKTDVIKKMVNSCHSDHSIHSNIVQSPHEIIINHEYKIHDDGEYKKISTSGHCLKSFNIFRHRPPQSNFLLINNQYYLNYYFQSFSNSKSSFSKTFLLFRKIKNWFTSVQMSKKQKRKMRSLYDEIYTGIQSERPISNTNFKTKLSRMMLMSKLSNHKIKYCIDDFEKSGDKQDLNSDYSHFISKRLFYKHLNKKKWSILKSPHGHGWITSDNPGLSVNIQPHSDGSEYLKVDPYWMCIDSDELIYFPLSKAYCLRLEPITIDTEEENAFENEVIFFEISTEKELEAVNKLVVSAKPNVIISEERGITQLQTI